MVGRSTEWRRRLARERALTHDAIAAALRRFEAGGGLIRRLPDEPNPVRRVVGAEQAAYEWPVVEREYLPAPMSIGAMRLERGME